YRARIPEAIPIARLPQVVLLDKGQDLIESARGLALGRQRGTRCVVRRSIVPTLGRGVRKITPARNGLGWKAAIGVVEVMDRQAHLLEIVGALDTVSRLPYLLHRRQEQGDQHPNNGNDYQ